MVAPLTIFHRVWDQGFSWQEKARLLNTCRGASLLLPQWLEEITDRTAGLKAGKTNLRLVAFMRWVNELAEELQKIHPGALAVEAPRQVETNWRPFLRLLDRHRRIRRTLAGTQTEGRNNRVLGRWILLMDRLWVLSLAGSVLRKTQIPDMVQPYLDLEDVPAKQALFAGKELWRCPALRAPAVCEFCRKQVVSAASYHTTGCVKSTREYNYWAGEPTDSGGPVIIFGCQRCIAKHAESTYEQGYSPWIRSYRVLRRWELWEKTTPGLYARCRPWLRTDTRSDWREYIGKLPDVLTETVALKIPWDARAGLQATRQAARQPRKRDSRASTASTRGYPKISSLFPVCLIGAVRAARIEARYVAGPTTLGERQGPDDGLRWEELGRERAEAPRGRAGGKGQRKGRKGGQAVRPEGPEQTGQTKGRGSRKGQTKGRRKGGRE